MKGHKGFMEIFAKLRKFLNFIEEVECTTVFLKKKKYQIDYVVWDENFFKKTSTFE